MNPVNPYGKYKENSIMTASPGEITLMLFEGCWKFLKKAKIALDERNIQESSNNLIKAQNIVIELMDSLDFNYEISHNLFKVYEFVYHELVEINITKDAERIVPIIDIMYGYYETWKEVVKKDRIEKHMDAGGYV